MIEFMLAHPYLYTAHLLVLVIAALAITDSVTKAYMYGKGDNK